jgi:hypothetical protein
MPKISSALRDRSGPLLSGIIDLVSPVFRASGDVFVFRLSGTGRLAPAGSGHDWRRPRIVRHDSGVIESVYDASCCEIL